MTGTASHRKTPVIGYKKLTMVRTVSNRSRVTSRREKPERRVFRIYGVGNRNTEWGCSKRANKMGVIETKLQGSAISKESFRIQSVVKQDRSLGKSQTLHFAAVG